MKIAMLMFGKMLSEDLDSWMLIISGYSKKGL